MAEIQHGDKYQAVFNGSEWVVTWVDSVPLKAGDIIEFGVEEVVPVILYALNSVLQADISKINSVSLVSIVNVNEITLS